MTKYHLSADDLNNIETNSRDLTNIIARLKKATSFKMGDYLICYEIYYDTSQKVLKTNTYGATIKYIVAYTDVNNVAYVKQLNGSNEPMGHIIPLISFEHQDKWSHRHNVRSFEFELDPEYTESLIFQAEDIFNPMEKHNEAKSLRKQITEHNKKSKFNLDDCNAAIETINKLEFGHTYWISPKRGFTVLESKVIATPTGSYRKTNAQLMNKYMHNSGKRASENMKYGRKYPHVRSIKIKWSNGKEETRLPHTFINTNLYSEIPRSYKELSDTN